MPAFLFVTDFAGYLTRFVPTNFLIKTSRGRLVPSDGPTIPSASWRQLTLPPHLKRGDLFEATKSIPYFLED